MNLQKIGKVFMNKCVGTGPSFYKKKRIYGARSHKGWETLHYTILIRLTEGYIYTVYTLKLKNLRYETSLPLKKTKDHKIHVFVHNLQTTFTSLDTWGWKAVHN